MSAPDLHKRCAFWARGVVLAALAACGKSTGPPDAGGPRSVAHLEFLQGTVTLERAGQRGPAELGYIFAKDALETGADGQVRLQLGGARTVQMGPDSRFVLEEEDGALVLQLPRGTIETQGAQGALSIRTPFGRTQVGAENSSLTLRVDPNGSQVNVLFGRVELVGTNGERSEAGKGDRFMLTLGKLERVVEARPVELAPLEFVLAEPAAAQVRRAGQRGWGALPRGQPLRDGDAVRLGQGRAVLQGGTQTLGLNGGVELTFKGARRDGAVQASAVDLAKGALDVELEDGARSRVNVNGLELESASGGQFTVNKTPDGYEVIARTGDLTAKKDGVEQRIQAGELARVRARGPTEVGQAPSSTVQLPSRGDTRVFHAGSVGEVSVLWPGDKRDYFIEVGADPEFKRRVVAGVVHQPSLNLPAPRQGNLFWRVFETDRKTLLVRGSASFRPETTESRTTFLDTVQEGSDRTTIYYQNALPAVTLAYKTDPQAQKYHLRVVKPDALTAPVVDRFSPNGRVTLEAGTLPEGNYFWSVTPVSATGEELRGGKMTKLDIVYDNAVPSLMVRSPRNGDGASGNKVQAVGVAPVGAKVLINGRSATLDEKGRFDEPVQVASRSASVVFRLVRPNVFDVIVVRSLSRGAPR